MKKSECLRSMCRRLQRMLVALAILATSIGVSAQDFNLSRDFSTNSTPNGVWSYGWKETLASSLNLYTHSHTSFSANGVRIQIIDAADSVLPEIYYNAGTNTAVTDGGQGQFPPGTVWYLAGNNGTSQNYGVIRFTAPSNGNYRVGVAVRSHLDGPLSGDTDFYVVRNSTELVGWFLGPNSGRTFTNAYDLAAGDVIDFAVGRGADNNVYASALKIAAVITPTTNGPIVTNPPPICTFALSPSNGTHTAAGGTGVVAVATQTNCSWAAFSTNFWIHAGTLTNVGSGSVTYLVDANTSSVPRSGSIRIDGQNFLVSQAGAQVITNPPPVFGDFNLSRDFTTNSNPSGVWSYGWKSNLTSGLVLVTRIGQSVAANGVPYEYWNFSTQPSPLFMHYPLSNTATGVISSGVFPPGTVLIDPGVNGSPQNFAIVRFTAPSNGIYQVQSLASPCYNGSPQGDTDFHVVKNGTEIFGQFLAATQQVGFTNELALASGDTIDFAVGRGADNNEFGSVQRLAAIITLTTNGAVTNPPPVCTFALSPFNGTHTATGGTGVVSVATQTNCSWTAFSTNFWIHAGTLTNVGSGSVSYLVDANTSSVARVGAIHIDGQNFLINQSGAQVITNPPPVFGDFNLTRDFSTNTNPNGVWSYGWQSNLNLGLNLLNRNRNSTANNGTPYQILEYLSSSSPLVMYYPISNTTTGTSGATLYPPGTLLLDPGTAAPYNLATVRFTAPSNGTYQVRATVGPQHQDSRQGDTDFHVSRNGAEIFSQFLAPQDSVNYSNNIVLNSGDKVDFAIGRGTDGNEYGSVVRLTAIITPSANPPPAFGDFNLAVEFSTNSNPNGFWSYGWKSNLSSSLVLFPLTRTGFDGSGYPYQIWEPAAGALPGVYFNPGPNTLMSDGGQAVYPPGTMWFYPGNSPRNLGVIRFTAPSNSNYEVGVAVRSYLDGPLSGDTDFHVSKNGSELFGRFLPSQGGTNYTNVISMAIGDTIEFAVGRGADNNQYASALKIAARIVPTTNGPTVTNPPPVCTFALSPSNRTHTAAGGTGVVSVVTQTGCVWTAFSTNFWIHLASLTNAGNGIVNYLVDANTSSVARVGAIHIDGQNFLITQLGTQIVTNPPPSGDFNLSRDFLVNVNPSGVWSYGWKQNLGGSFALLSAVRTFSSDNGVTIRAWELSTYNLPVVAKVTGNATAISDGGRFTAPPGTVYFAPGADETPQNFGVIRFIAPSNGNYQVATVVNPLFDSTRSRDSDFHVVKNGSEIYGTFLPPNFGTNAFFGVMALIAGESVDFAIGRGSDGTTIDTGLKISVVITPTTNAVSITNVPPGSPGDFNLSRDFLLNANPSGAWSYGWKESLNGAFGLLPAFRTFASDNGVEISVWELSTYSLPAIAKVTGNALAVSDGGRFTAPSGTVYFAPGADATPQNFGVIRFVAPSNGSYRVQTTVNPLFDGTRSRDSDFHVVKNGVEVYGASLPPNFGTNVFSNVMALNSGEAVDFAVGRGPDGTTLDTGLKIAVFITPTTNGLPTNPPPVCTFALSPSNRTHSAAGGTGVVTVGTQPGCGWFAFSTNSWLHAGPITNVGGGTLSYFVDANASSQPRSGIIRIDGQIFVVNQSGSGATNLPPVIFGDFNPARDFSTNSNPNGVWSYGWKSNIASPLVLLPLTRTGFDGSGYPYQIWEPGVGALPGVYFNAGTNTLSSDGGQGVYPPGTLWFYPGNSPRRLGVIRFTAPSNSNYQVGVAVKAVLAGPSSGDTDFHLIKNGMEMFGQIVPGSGATSYTNVLHLNGGDVVDFAVGPGADNSISGSDLKIQALITPTTTAPIASAPGETKTATVSGFTREADGTIQFSVAGDGNTIYVIQASTDLVNWTEVGIVVSASGTVRFKDPDGATYPNRFYRAVPVE